MVACVYVLILLSVSTASLADAVPDSEATLQSLNTQISKLIDKQSFTDAVPLARQSLELNESLHGKDDASNNRYLNNLGWLLQKKGDYGQARQMFETAISLAEKHKLEDAEYAGSLNNLATLLYTQGDLEIARTLYQRALAINEKVLGPDDLKVAFTLRNLAGVLDATGKDEALTHYQRALAIQEKQKTPDQLELAQTLNSLAASLEDKGKYNEALPLFERALTSMQAVLGTAHLELAGCLNNTAMLYLDLKQKEKAKPLFLRALAITEKQVGSMHIELVPILNNLGDLELLSQNIAPAQEYYLRAGEIVNSYFADILPYCSIAEKQAAFDLYSKEQVARLLSVCRNSSQLSSAYEEFFLWKGTIVSALSVESKKRRSANSSQTINQLEELRKVRAQLSGWYLEAFRLPPGQWNEKNVRLTAEKEKLERTIAAADPNLKSTPANSLLQFSSSLKPDEAFIDIYSYELISTKDDSMVQTPHYAAVLISGGVDQKPLYVDIGNANALQSKLKQWRDEVIAEKPATETWKLLSDALILPFNKLPAGVKKIWVSPDGELARVPWHLIADAATDGKRLLVCQIDSPRELSALKSSPAVPAGATTTLLLAGGVDFNAGAGAGTGADPEHRSFIVFPPLPGSLLEEKEIAELGKSAKFSLIELTGNSASKSELLSCLPRANYIHLATHGFFFDESMFNPPGESGQSSRAVFVRPRQEANQTRRNPLVESGIALAGANIASSGEQEKKPGCLTAEEFIGCDLSRCKLVTLSACDTGRGKEITGQGVMGLRASIMAAGAHSVLMSLWKIPDIQTVDLMKELYKNLWLKNMNEAEALKQAQTTLLEQLPPGKRLPKYWAPWVLVGEGW